MGSHTTGHSAGGTIGAGSLQVKASLGGFTVRHVAEGRLTLRGSRVFATKAIALGTVMLIVGLCGWAAAIRHDQGKPSRSSLTPGRYVVTGPKEQRPWTPPSKVLFLPLTGMIAVILGVIRLGETWELDAKSRVLVIYRFLGHKVLRPGFFNRVRLTALPTNMKQRETLVLDLVVSDRIWYSVGRRRTNKPDAANLIVAARQIAAMLGLPIEVAGSLQEASPSLLAQFDNVDAPRPLYRAA